MTDILNNIIIPSLSTIVLALLGLGVKYVIGLLKSKGIITKLEANKNVVSIVVNAIEQIYKNTGTKGEDKLKAAEEKVVNILASKGIKITQDEIRVLIENCIREINDTVKNEIK